MAEDKKEAVEEVKKKKSPILIIVIVGMLILFGASGFIAWKYFIPKLLIKERAQAEAEKKDKIGVIFPLETFVVNLADQDNQKYLKISIQLEMIGPKVTEELRKRDPQLRDLIIGLLSMQKYSDVSTYKGKTNIRKEIISRINNVLLTGSVKRVFFTEFVLQ